METIGDAYVVVGGVPKRIGKRHVSEIADVALDLLSTVTSFKIPHRPEHQLQIRIGQWLRVLCAYAMEIIAFYSIQ